MTSEIDINSKQIRHFYYRFHHLAFGSSLLYCVYNVLKLVDASPMFDRVINVGWHFQQLYQQPGSLGAIITEKANSR